MGQEQETELKMTSVELIEASRRIIAAFIYDPDKMPCKAWKLAYAHPVHQRIADDYIGLKALQGLPLHVEEVGRMFSKQRNAEDFTEWERVRAEVARIAQDMARDEKIAMAQIGGYFADFMKAETQKAAEKEWKSILDLRDSTPPSNKRRFGLVMFDDDYEQDGLIKRKKVRK